MTDVALPVGPEQIEAAARRLAEHVHRTPCLSFRTAASGRDGSLFLKCENLQKVGAFKARGALNYLLGEDEADLRRGVVTYSSGNHGAAVAWAASLRGAPARVYVPEDVPESKAAAIAGYGGEVIRAGRSSADRKRAALADATDSGAVVVPPFDHERIVAGQGTVGREILEQQPDVNRVLVPVGGGGVFSGITAAIKTQRPEVDVIGVEPVHAACMTEALAAGEPVDVELGLSEADGLRPVRAGTLCHRIVSELGARTVTVPDEWILDAMRLLLERARLVVEPSGAAALAAYLHHPEVATDGITVVVLTGGNVDVARMTALLA